ncbi:hypothetical protein N8466_00190 [Gammaproteobacteria bacterium]|nr:hypothetical protein [Gammaproteobacteria bacterium]
MEKIQEITKGKAKSLFTTSSDDQLIMHFSDDTSAFDGKKMEALMGKGSVNNQFNAFILEHLQENGVDTHLIEVLSKTDSFGWATKNQIDEMKSLTYKINTILTELFLIFQENDQQLQEHPFHLP